MMQKVLFLAVCAAMLASCISKKLYIITGEVDASYDGETLDAKIAEVLAE